LPTDREIDPAVPVALDPDSTCIAPELPGPLVAPELKRTTPETPAPAVALATTMLPLHVAEELPLVTAIPPPKPPLPVLLPDDTEILPPDPDPPLPTDNVIDPPVPADDTPDSKLRLPLDPPDDEPDDNTTLPLTVGLLVNDALPTLTAPLDTPEPTPLENVNAPPLDKPDPPVTFTAPPTPLLPLLKPATTDTSPPTAAPLSPTDNEIAPAVPLPLEPDAILTPPDTCALFGLEAAGAAPVRNVNDPVFPLTTLAAFADAINTLPLHVAVDDAPLESVMLPPKPPTAEPPDTLTSPPSLPLTPASEVAPALNVMSPPAPEAPTPTNNEMDPPLPLDDAPVLNVILPLEP